MEISIRKAIIDDIGEIARLHRLSMRTAMPFLPEIHTPDEDIEYFSKTMFPNTQMTIAQVGSEKTIYGFSSYSDGWLHHLYVHPDKQGLRIGSSLLNELMAECSAIDLWAFQRNENARRFYEKHNFVLVEETDGATNEQSEPDVHYAWRR